MPSNERMNPPCRWKPRPNWRGFFWQAKLPHHLTEQMMRATLRLAVMALFLIGFSPEFADAQDQPPPPPASAPQRSDTYTPDEVVGAGSRFFGEVSSGLAKVIE